jgi:hypothetical protein
MPPKERTEECIKYKSDTHFDGQEARMRVVEQRLEQRHEEPEVDPNGLGGGG